METSSSIKSGIDFVKFRIIVKNFIDKHHYWNAEFWANKLVTLSGGAPIDVYNLARCYFLTKQYHRAVLLVTSHNLLKDIHCRYIAARCYFEAGELLDALNVLAYDKKENKETEAEMTPLIPEIGDDSSMEPLLELLRGWIHDASDNRPLAAECFRNALKLDPLCYEALHALSKHNMLPVQEEAELISSLNLDQVCSCEEEKTLVLSSYGTKLNKYSGLDLQATKPPLQPSLQCLQINFDFVTAEAEKLYYQCDFNRCFKLTQKIVQSDPYHPECLPIHIACLVELKKSNSLFLLAHKLVASYPENAITWYAVGCYYYLIGKHDICRRLLTKATSLDASFGPACIAAGHSLAAENEHDQARAAYYKAAQIMKGCHLHLLYIGMEYGLTNNKIAEKFLTEALCLAPKDPFVFHELGVVAYNNKDFVKAETYFDDALKLLDWGSGCGRGAVGHKWAPLLSNIANTACKLAKYDRALEFHQQSLLASPGNASSYAGIGVVEAMRGDLSAASEALHKALALQKDHTVAASLLNAIMNSLVVSSPAVTDDICLDDFPPLKGGLTTCSIDDIKNSLGSSIGQPMMHSSQIATQSSDQIRPQLPDSSSESAMLIEDMSMDEDSS